MAPNRHNLSQSGTKFTGEVLQGMFTITNNFAYKSEKTVAVAPSIVSVNYMYM